MGMIDVSVLLSTTNYNSTCRGDSSGDCSYEGGDEQLKDSKTHLVGLLHHPLTVSFTESRDSG